MHNFIQGTASWGLGSHFVEVFVVVVVVGFVRMYNHDVHEMATTPITTNRFDQSECSMMSEPRNPVNVVPAEVPDMMMPMMDVRSAVGTCLVRIAVMEG